MAQTVYAVSRWNGRLTLSPLDERGELTGQELIATRPENDRIQEVIILLRMVDEAGLRFVGTIPGGADAFFVVTEPKEPKQIPDSDAPSAYDLSHPGHPARRRC